MEFQKRPAGWTGMPAPRARFKLPAGALDAHSMFSACSRKFPYARRNNAVRCFKASDVCPARSSRPRAQRGRAGHLSPARQPRDGRMRSAFRWQSARGCDVKRDVSDGELHAMHDAGVRGVRFNFVRRLVDFTPRGELMEIAGRMPSSLACRDLFRSDDLPELWGFFTAVPTIISSTHMGRPDVAKPVDGSEFEAVCEVHAAAPNVWSKAAARNGCRFRTAGAQRRAKSLPRRDPVRPRIVETFPDACSGHDWPHPI